MDVTFHLTPAAAHQYEHANALKEGMRLHGVNPRDGIHNAYCGSELSVIWSWKQADLTTKAAANGNHILVMERGYLPDRMQWCSLSLDGMNGLGTAPEAPDSKRWRSKFEHLLKPWKKHVHNKVALVIGQVPGDPTLYGTDMYDWVEATIKQLQANGYHVIYRRHPWMQNKIKQGLLSNPYMPPADIELSTCTLEEDLARISLCVTFSSNTGVESVLAGIPTMAFHPGSMVYNLSSQDFTNAVRKPDRTKWCRNMAYRQWTLDELRDGTAWEFIRQGIK